LEGESRNGERKNENGLEASSSARSFVVQTDAKLSAGSGLEALYYTAQLAFEDGI